MLKGSKQPWTAASGLFLLTASLDGATKRTIRKVGAIPVSHYVYRTAVAGIFLFVLGSAYAASSYAPTLWIGTQHRLARLSATDGSILSEIAIGPHRPNAMAVDVVDGDVWLLHHGTLDVYDESGHLLHVLRVPQQVRVTGRARLAIDRKADRVWLSSGDRLYWLDLEGQFLGELRLRHFDRAMALELGNSRLWVAAGRRLVAYDVTGHIAATVNLSGHGPVKTLAYSQSLSSLWVIQGRELYRYTRTDWQKAAKVRLPRDAGDSLAVDGSGAVWVAGKHTLMRIDGSGAVDFTSHPTQSLHDHLVSLVTDPADHSAWLTGKHVLIHESVNGEVLQAIDLDKRDHEGHHEAGHGHHSHHLGPVDVAALWADTASPALSFLKPPESTYVANTKPSLVFHYSDLGSGTNLSSLSLTVNGQSVGVSCQSPASDSTSAPASVTVACALAAPLSQGGQSLSATVEDYAGNDSKPTTRSFTVDTIPPTIMITQPSGKYNNQPHLALGGELSEAGTLAVNGAAVTLDVNLDFSDPLDLTEGSNTLKLVATDLAGNTTAENSTIILDTVPPPLPNLGLISISGPNKDSQVTVTGKKGAVEGGATVIITDTRTGASTTVTANSDGSFVAQIAAGPSDKLSITITDEAGNVTTDPTTIDVSNLPPDPSQVASTLSQTDATPFIDQVSFLYNGSNPIQTGVQSGAIKAYRVAVVRGEVIDRSGNPLPGATVSVQGHPELGKTLSRADGHYDLVVDGGGQVVLSFSKKNYLSAWRSVKTSWKNYSIASTVALVKEDPDVTTVSFGAGAPAAVASGSIQTGASGTRRTLIYFPAGTTADMVMPDGSTQPLTAGSVRATEYTVGPNGSEAMPANLPPTSAYTYAVGLTIDQAETAGASTVKFNQPVPVYVNNYLDFPVGTHVPAAWYDVKKASWVPINDGRVIKLLDVNAQGEADLDTSGTGAPVSTTTLTAMGITPAERIKLATLYTPGATFWRVPVTHFTDFDFNWWGVTQDLLGANATTNPTPDQVCPQRGCIIKAQTQVVAEKIPVTGTPFDLYYSSGRQKGYAASRTANITLTGSTLPPDLAGVELQVNVAGQLLQKSFTPKPDLSYTYTWNGLDAYGRTILGTVKGTVKVTYITPIKYVPIHNFSQSFAVGADEDPTDIIAVRNDHYERVTKEFRITLSNNQIATVSDALGGWNLGVHDSYDPVSHTVYKGSGGVLKNKCAAGCLRLFAGGGGSSADGAPALNAHLGPIVGLAQDGEGDIYLAQYTTIKRINAAGIITTFAGGGGTPPASGVVATKARLNFSESETGMSTGPNGNLYFLQIESATSKLFRIDNTQVIHFVTTIPCVGDSLKIGGDGSAYVLCFGNYNGNPHILYRVSPGGVVNPIATGEVDYGDVFGDGLALCSNRDIYYWADNSNPYYLHELTAGGGKYTYSYDISSYIEDISCDENGGIYIAQSNLYDSADGIIYRKPDGQYVRITKGSNNPHLYPVNGTLLDQNYFNDESEYTYDLKVLYSSAYHGVFIAHASRLWFVPGNPGMATAGFSGLKQSKLAGSGAAILGEGEVSNNDAATVASPSGGLVYRFNAQGLESIALNALADTPVYTFSYNQTGQLDSITDANGNVTKIVRNSAGSPTEIIAPTGQITSLSVGKNGYLTAIRNPLGSAYQMSYSPEGLVQSYTDPDGRTETYSYSALGRLTRNVTAAKGGWTIARSQSGGSYTVQMTSAMGRVSSYQVANAGTGVEKQVSTAPDGLNTITENYLNGNTQVTEPDGTVIKNGFKPDPRFSLQSPEPSSVITTPSGLSYQSSVTRAATLASVSDPLSLTSFTQNTVINGRKATYTYTASAHQWAITSPMGRTNATTVDTQDRPVTVKAPALATVAYAYNTEGRLTSVKVGSGSMARQSAFSYYTSGPSQGWLHAVTDSMGRKTTYGYDAGGHVTSQVLPDGEVIRFGYDSVGNLISVTPPSRPAHGMSYTAADEFASYTPPAASTAASGVVQYSYNLDRQLTGITLPSSRNVSLQYNSSGQITTMATQSGQYQYGYSTKTGQLMSLVAGADGESLGFAYDGFLLTQTVYTGPISGTLKATYNNNFQVTSLSVGGTRIAYEYDTDGLLKLAGGLAVSRDIKNGLVTGTTLYSVKTNRSYDRFGETTAYAVAAGSGAVYAASYTYDKDGEITTVSETAAGVTKSRSYVYDKNGRLTTITQNGVTSTYGYDANGNRITVNGAKVATYNARDQLLTYGNNTYIWNADGELAAKITPSGATHYTWNALGELTDVNLPGGTNIHYLYDGLGRRIGKEKNGTLLAGYLYAGSRIVAETDATGQVTERFVYASRGNVPDYMITYGKGSVTGTYRLVSNQVGSVREVVDVTTGAVVQQIDYGVWGNITRNTNPSFQPFAFAGGLHDSDTSLVHFGARDYDPETGRWISRDPIMFAGGDADLYRYVIGDPVNLIDSNGHGVIVGFIGAIVGGAIGGITEALQGGSWKDITISTLAGAGTGALAGLTFGASLLAEGSAGSIALNIGAKSFITGGIEAGRELVTGNGCLTARGVMSAVALGALGDGAGAAAWRSMEPFSRAAADVWDGIFGSTVDGSMGLAIAAGRANDRASSWMK